ncbi:MAG: hypothetical protein ABFD52_04850 [Acidobacteriota bacterium]
MIRYKNPVTGADVITTNDGRPHESKRARGIDRITTADIERLPDGTFRRKGEKAEPEVSNEKQ